MSCSAADEKVALAGDRRPQHQRRSSNKRGAGGANANRSTASPQTFKGEAFLVVTLVVSGRSPLNGWIVSLGAVLVSAERRSVLGLFERNLLPLAAHHRVEPAADVVGFLRRQRPELEFMSRDRCPPLQAMADLGRFCAAYKNLTLVGSPLMSVYGWLSYYWSAYQQSVVDQAPPSSSAPPPMPWGYSGLCARSYVSGCLGVSMKQVIKDKRYQDASSGFQAVGLPLADALAAAAGFTHFHWLRQQQQQQQCAPQFDAAADTAALSPLPPPLTFEAAVPEYLTELGCVPPLPGDSANGTSSCSLCQRTLLELLVDASIRNGLERHAPSSPRTTPRSSQATTTPSTATPQPACFIEYPSITSLEFHPDFERTLPEVLHSGETWVATEKVHGSNFLVFCDGTEVWAGKRTGWLGLRDSPAFFDFVYLLEEARPAIMACHKHVAAWLSGRGLEGSGSSPAEPVQLTIAIACELAGGDYPHPQVPVDLCGTRVQSGVFYCNRNFLYGFDIGIEAIEATAPALAASLRSDLQTTLATQPAHDSRGCAEQGTVEFMPWGPDGRYYLPFTVADAIFDASGFPTRATALRTGTLDELRGEANLGIFASTIARRWFDLPDLLDNMAEGVVLRPSRDWWMRRLAPGDAALDSAAGDDNVWSRVMIKVKHPRFSEFSHKHGSKPGSPATAAEAPAPTRAFTPAVNITDFLTEARVSAVLSKHTLDEQQNTERMVKAVLADAMKDAAALQQLHAQEHSPHP